MPRRYDVPKLCSPLRYDSAMQQTAPSRHDIVCSHAMSQLPSPASTTRTRTCNVVCSHALTI
ncbi:hypothetical protein PAXRUDRAFT_829981 [Paxillus rubicundulus Ve08.2h10]|uniref:Uncharacterized protein n=1 Tax=Paxillus rubicundulus Ve08.2h10 TaxID=930991 RepID=A0A0D0DU71_9AGAM|nr:hypothetical protein PAXRUDRAFT_829981 [Paxillus rubicundulus Ve08.2h10]